MYFCPNCGQDLPDDALFCSSCGSSVLHLGVPVDSGTTSQTPTPIPVGGQGLPAPPQEEGKRSPLTARRGLVIMIIGVLALLLVGTVFETGALNQSPVSASTVNSASNPLTGGQLYSAYTNNPPQAASSYTNKTVYLEDTLDFGVAQDSGTGRYYSSVNSGTVILVWRDPHQLGSLNAGSVVLAECVVRGAGYSQGAGYLVFLQNCDLINVQSQPSTTATITSIPAESV